MSRRPARRSQPHPRRASEHVTVTGPASVLPAQSPAQASDIRVPSWSRALRSAESGKPVRGTRADGS